jgi:hypothetical protein
MVFNSFKAIILAAGLSACSGVTSNNQHSEGPNNIAAQTALEHLPSQSNPVALYQEHTCESIRESIAAGSDIYIWGRALSFSHPESPTEADLDRAAKELLAECRYTIPNTPYCNEMNEMTNNVIFDATNIGKFHELAMECLMETLRSR